MTVSNRFLHWFHVISNVRPLVWICSYIVLIPIFALIYWFMPDWQFRIPDGAGTDFGSWLYYSIVTITTLGFGDYTPAHGWAQAVTAIEVGCGLVLLGFFLNAVGSMKSEIDVTSAVERQKALHKAEELDRLRRNVPNVMHLLDNFLAYCYAVSTPESKRTQDTEYNPDFTFADMADLYKPSRLGNDLTGQSAVEGLLKSAYRTSLCLDSLQTRVDLELWPNLLEECFSFVANCEIFSSADNLTAAFHNAGRNTRDSAAIAARIAQTPTAPELQKAGDLAPEVELYHFIKDNAGLAQSIETRLTAIGVAPADSSSAEAH